MLRSLVEPEQNGIIDLHRSTLLPVIHALSPIFLSLYHFHLTPDLYVRIIVLMYWQDPAPDGPTVAVPSLLTNTAIAVAVAVTVVLGVWPQSVLDLEHQAGPFLT